MGADDSVVEAVAAVVALLERWQRRINLVARGSLADVWRRHVLDSAQLVPHLPEAPATIVDLGSGAGFPGLVVALVAGREVHLVESDGRKCAFLREAARLSGAPVIVHNQRVEALGGVTAEAVLARGCAPLPKLLALAQPVLGEHGIGLFLKGRQVGAELTEARKAWMMRPTLLPSRSDPSGTILKVEALRRRDGPRSH